MVLYWSVGKRVHEEVLGGERAAYGQEVVKRQAAGPLVVDLCREDTLQRTDWF